MTGTRSTATEDRLRAALAAKAATVDRCDLRRAVPPPAGQRTARRARTAALCALAAVVAGVALALPGALAHHQDREPATRPRHTSTPAPEPSGPRGRSPLPVQPVPGTPGGPVSGAAGSSAPGSGTPESGGAPSPR
ncbi:hypothetical protein AB0910_14840 [Streptomyces sp. NPDC047002]|uniref:hypothetical protein n=1 Tax=Streptomyces sp. NPDC047002 TaxID=3155475 RepID=UPI003454E411